MFKSGRRTRVAALTLATVAALGLTACSSGEASFSNASVNTVDANFAETVDGLMSTALAQTGSTNAILGVWTPGGDYVTAYGEGITANSQFRAAQTAQPALCATLLELVDDGKISLDRVVAEDLPRQAGIDGVTYGQLCTNTSGIANFSNRFATLNANNPTRPWSDRELIAEGLAVSPLAWPGLDVNISDTNALILARALNNVTGTPVAELLNTRVFTPAHMSSSYLPEELLPASSLPGDGMHGLTYPISRWAPQCDVGVSDAAVISPSMLHNAGGTVTTVTDLKNFYTEYLGGSFGGEHAARITEVTATTNPVRNEAGEAVGGTEDADARLAEIANPNGQKWGFGLEKTQSLYGQSGSITGTLSASYTDPVTGFTVALALNNSSAGIQYARNLAFSIATAASAAGVGPEVAWNADELAGVLASLAVCQPAPEAEPAAE